MQINWKNTIPHLVAILTFVLVTCLYFFPQFENKKVQQGDYISYEGMVQEIKAHKQETGESSLWTNSMFGGMPAYQIYAQQKYNAGRYFKKVMTLGFEKPIGMFLLGLFSTYILLLVLGVNPWLALFFSFSTAFATNNLVLYEAGHITKVIALMAAPLVIAGTLLTYKSRRYLGFSLFCLGMIMHLAANHYQMTYYLALCLLIFVIMQLVEDVKGGTLKAFAINSGLLALGFGLALGTSASKLMTTYEYAKDTMRGEPILTKDVDKSSSSGVDGLAWDYAMQWSNGGKDLLASFIPMAVGGSSSETIKGNSDFGKALKKRGVSVGKGIPMNTYWGALPFTSGPIYFGSIIFLLFLFGAMIYPGNIKWWAVGAVVFTMLISLGKNFELFNRILFDFFPYFNKFRTPNSVLSITSLIIPILSGLAINKIVSAQDKTKFIKPLAISGGILAGLSLLLGLIGPGIFDFSSAADTRYQQMGLDTLLLEEHRAAMLRSSGLRSFAFMAIAIGLIFAYLKGKLPALAMIIGIGLSSFVDIMLVNINYLNSDSFVSERVYNQYFTPRAVDQQILSDADPHYRVLDLSINTFNSSQSSYFHKTVGGYHAAKLQRYQDIIDYHISKNNQNVLDMLNTKYIIGTGNAQEPVVRLNPSNLGNAWFVNAVKLVGSADEEISALNDFDPRGEAIIHQEFESSIASKTFDKEGSIALSSYAPDKLTYTSQSSSQQLAVFSEVWYGPNKGWKLFIDGEESPILRANYILRAAVVPAGSHQIEMRFEPQTYALGETISLITSLLISLIILGGLYMAFKANGRSKELIDTNTSES